MNAPACLLLTSMCVGFVLLAPLDANPSGKGDSKPHTLVDINATSTSHAEGAQTQDADDVEDAFQLKPEPVVDGKPHNLIVGNCNETDNLLHTENIIVNNDGHSRVAGDVRVNVEAPVNITCFKVLDLAGNSSGAFPSYLSGGLGHNYVVFDFDTAYGHSIRFQVEVYGHNI